MVKINVIKALDILELARIFGHKLGALDEREIETTSFYQYRNDYDNWKGLAVLRHLKTLIRRIREAKNIVKKSEKER